jgi:hypothetical protein
MTLHRLIYVSRPFGFDSATLGGILVAARRNNARDGLTGALICRADLYLQLLEGPAAAVTDTYARIVGDDRHCDVERLVSVPAAGRLFPAWDMLDDPARSWLWSPADVAHGAVTAAAPDAIVAVFARLASERKVTQGHGMAGENRGTSPATCPAAALP